jgi:hypothetical protein
MKFKIERGIEMPVRSKDIRYPLAEMEVGDSFSFPLEYRASVQTLASAAKKQGRAYRVKKIAPEVCRIWRIS